MPRKRRDETTADQTYTFTGTVSGGGTIQGTFTIPGVPIPPIPPNGGEDMPAFAYWQMYADREDSAPETWKRIVNPKPDTQWGDALTISPGPWPPGYKVPNGQEGGGYPSGTSDGTLPIRLVPPQSGNGVRFQFYTTATCTVLNEGNQDGKFLWGLGVVYPSEVGRPMNPYLGVFHSINDYRKMVPITIPAGKAVQLTVVRLDVLDPDFADIPGWPDWKMTPNGDNKLWPAVSPTWWNGGPGPLNVKDIMAVGYAVNY